VAVVVESWGRTRQREWRRPTVLRNYSITPAQFAGALSPAPAALDHYGWQQHFRGPFEIPGDGGGSTHGVAGSATVIVATVFKAVGRLPSNLHTPVKACPPVGVVRIPTFARAHAASGQWKTRGLPRQETQCTQLLRSFAARMAGCDDYRMVGRVASALWLLVRPRGRFTP